jgi:tRNA(Ile)-lysidine synthase TilS/MesJ
MKKRKSKDDQMSLALWAADCAEHALPYFEKECPGDDRPRKAIEAGRAWARGEIKVGEARTAALAAHAAARDTDHSAARAAARAAGHSAATAHVAGHAPHAADYAVKAAEAAGIAGEREWQYRHLPERLRQKFIAGHCAVKKINK